MLAAVLHEPGGIPRAETFSDPQPQGDEFAVRVLAAGLHPLVRGHANNTHYTSHGIYPLIPGIDGVCELPDGRHAYFGWLRPPYGTFAEHAAIAPNALPVPAGLSPTIAAGIVNPAMSSWLALTLRAKLRPGERVFVLGATGASGQLAVQVARTLGASHVVAAGRNAAALEKVRADATLRTDAEDFQDALTRELAKGVHVVLDYLWGAPARATFEALLAARTDLGRVRYVNIGEVAGHHIEFSPHVLRSSPVELMGSGFGSVSPREIAGEIPKILAAAAKGTLTIEIEAVPLARIAEAWTTKAGPGKRIVIVP